MKDSEKLGSVISARSTAHKQERSGLTRTQLIAAARDVFARDGFESARLEDIAAKAGKTRGAFYANFKDKEDVFFAIFEEDQAHYQEKISSAMAAGRTIDEKAGVLAEQLSELLSNRQRILLNLEFKMYVIRHPSKRKRLANLHSEMCMRCAMTHINTLLPEYIGKDLEKRRSIAMQIGAILDGLALNVLFNPEAISEELRKHHLKTALKEIVRVAEKDLV